MKSQKNWTPLWTVLLVLGAVVLYWGLNHLGPITQALGTLLGFFFPFFLGCGLAFLLNIPMRAIERGLNRLSQGRAGRGLRPVSLILTLLIVLGVLTGVVFVVIPQLADTASSVVSQVTVFLAKCQVWLQELLVRYPDLPDFITSLDFNALITDLPGKITALVDSVGSQVVDSSITVATSVFSGVMNFSIAFVFALYLLAGKERISRQFGHLLQAFLPERWLVRIRYVARLVDKTFSSFFTGQCVEACILGALFFISMTLLRLPFASLIAVLVGFMALIPIFGAFIGCVVGALLILVENPIQALWFVILFLVLQQLEGNLIYPRVVGSSVGLPPIWVLAAVTVGGSMFGIVGMLLFIPTVSVLYSLLRDTIRRRLREKAAREKAPEPPARPG